MDDDSTTATTTLPPSCIIIINTKKKKRIFHVETALLLLLLHKISSSSTAKPSNNNNNNNHHNIQRLDHNSTATAATASDQRTGGLADDGSQQRRNIILHRRSSKESTTIVPGNQGSSGNLGLHSQHGPGHCSPSTKLSTPRSHHAGSSLARTTAGPHDATRHHPRTTTTHPAAATRCGGWHNPPSALAVWQRCLSGARRGANFHASRNGTGAMGQSTAQCATSRGRVRTQQRR
mmetsp:Transcript_20419/g.56385  ORF Transcript_20419/g.56385 Transcript_20419/m.56385 type:complete len:234 (+) Transcript_20419:1604-2305(+)